MKSKAAVSFSKEEGLEEEKFNCFLNCQEKIILLMKRKSLLFQKMRNLNLFLKKKVSNKYVTIFLVIYKTKVTKN